MAKVSLPQIVSGYLGAGKLNEALMAIAEALENTLSRDGTAPNQMEADLDMNGHSLLNTSFSSSPSSLVTLQGMQDYINTRASGLLIQRTELFTASAAQTTFVLTQFTYTPGSGNIAVYVNGIRKFAPSNYVEASATNIAFLAGLSAGDKVMVVQTDYLATASFAEHSHPWSQITNAPVYTTRWPSWTEVTGKPTTFTPASHSHTAADVTSGRFADARRGVYVQASAPTGLGAGDAGVLWFW